MDDRAIARWRMQMMRLSQGPYESHWAVVEGMLAVQSENHAQAAWAVAARTPGVTEAEFQRLFDDGAILRTHVLRPTWHFVIPDDIRWLVELSTPRVRRVIDQLQCHLGLDNAVLEASAEVIAGALGKSGHLTKAALGERLRDAGLPAEGQRLRYFAGHGPATERDLAYWATMTLTDVRAGLAAVADQLDHVEHGGRTYWFAHPPPADEQLQPRAHLLQILDESHYGYQDSRHVLDVEGLVPRARGSSVGMTLVDGQMVGDHRRRIRVNQVMFEVGLVRDLDGDELDAVRDAADRYRRLLQLHGAVVTAARNLGRR